MITQVAEGLYEVRIGTTLWWARSMTEATIVVLEAEARKWEIHDEC